MSRLALTEMTLSPYCLCTVSSSVSSSQLYKRMRPFGHSSRVTRAELEVGDIVWISITIDPRDTAHPGTNAASRYDLSSNNKTICLPLLEDSSTAVLRPLCSCNIQGYQRRGSCCLPCNVRAEHNFTWKHQRGLLGTHSARKAWGGWTRILPTPPGY